MSSIHLNLGPSASGAILDGNYNPGIMSFYATGGSSTSFEMKNNFSDFFIQDVTGTTANDVKAFPGSMVLVDGSRDITVIAPDSKYFTLYPGLSFQVVDATMGAGSSGASGPSSVLIDYVDKPVSGSTSSDFVQQVFTEPGFHLTSTYTGATFGWIVSKKTQPTLEDSIVVDITSAQVAILGSVGRDVILKKIGYGIEVISASVSYIAGATAYGSSSDIVLKSSSGEPQFIATNVLDSTTTRTVRFQPIGSTSTSSPIVEKSAPIRLRTSDLVDPIGGDGSLRLYIKYRLLDIP